MSLVLLTHKSESVRQTSSDHYYTTLQPYRSPEASSSTRQHHEREVAYPRCIGAYNPSPTIVRAGGADAYTPTTPHQPSPTATRTAIIALSPHGVLLSVVLAAACNSVVPMRACCHRLPIYVPDHHHAASLLFGQRYRDFFMYACYRSHSKLCVLTDVRTTTVYCFCYNRQQQHALGVIYTASREDSISANLQQLIDGS